MNFPIRTTLLVIISCTAAVCAQPMRGEPHIGYVYPGGGQRGTKVEVIVGGQSLRGVTEALISGGGVHAKVIQHYRPLQAIVQQQREQIRQRLGELIRKRMADMPGEGRGLGPLLQELAKAPKKDAVATTQESPLPEHPLLRNLEDKSLAELLHVRNELFNLRNRQPSPQIAESVLVEITLERNAPPGDREIRLLTPQGLTNPMCFQVSGWHEITEREPNDPQMQLAVALPDAPPMALPVVINGQIEPGDVDRFRLALRRGQQISIKVQARHLIPYLADAVPGWFQATAALIDSGGHEVAFADDNRFDPDPVLSYRAVEEGEYQLEIRDSLYRGRDDFVYRAAVGDAGTLQRAFPSGSTVNATQPWSDPLPECNEIEPNDLLDKAQLLVLPQMIKGRIGKPGDVDVFQFKARAGEEVVAEVYARRMSSPLDSLVRLMDASGHVLAFNDDHEDKETGLLTHHADSYLRTKMPRDGTYCLQVTDAQRHGGEPYSYRLRLGPPRPNFALRLTPSSLNIRPGGAVPVCVYALRKDGLDGDIDVALKDAPAGFRLDGQRMPKGCERICMTLTAPRDLPGEGLTLKLEGQARIGERVVHRAVIPCEDMMQAFIYRHLVPAQELRVAIMGQRRPVPPLEFTDRSPVRLRPGGTSELRIRAPRNPRQPDIQFELRDPPAGVTLQDVKNTPQGFVLTLKVDREKAKAGVVGNLIVEGFVEPPGGKTGKAPNKAQRVSVGVLPAMPFEILQP